MIHKNLPKSSGIYQILNTTTEKCYIGRSFNIRERIRNHFKALSDNKHYNKILQGSYNRYGITSFRIVILEYVVDKYEILANREQYYKDK